MLKGERLQLKIVCSQYHYRIVLGMAVTFIMTLLLFCVGIGGIYFYLASWKEEMIPLEDVLLRVQQTMFIGVCVLPVIIFLFWNLGWRVTYHTVGALHRITLELQKRIKTGDRSPIKIRKKDRIHELLQEINQLLALREPPKVCTKETALNSIEVGK